MSNQKTNIPSKEECLVILTKNKTPSNVIEHSKSVYKVAEETADKLIAKGMDVNKRLVIAAALLHDVERGKEDHVVAGANLIRSMGFPEVARVMLKHGLYRIENEDVQPKTTEEKIVFYADKRCTGSRVVTLRERIRELKKRYGKDFSKEYEFAKKIEKELLD